jgi:DNA modification methylase
MKLRIRIEAEAWHQMGLAVERNSRWYKNCRSVRKRGGKICESCPFREMIEEVERGWKQELGYTATDSQKAMYLRSMGEPSPEARGHARHGFRVWSDRVLGKDDRKA